MDENKLNKYWDELVEARKEYIKDGEGGDNAFVDYLYGGAKEFWKSLDFGDRAEVLDAIENELGI